VYEAFGMSGAVQAGAVAVVPVQTSAFSVLMVGEDNLVVQLAGPQRLEAFDTARLGYDASLLWSARGFVSAPWAAAKVA
jgi:hypothetical protein